MSLRLRLPRIDDEAEVLAAQQELSADGFTFAFLEPGEPFADLVARIEDQRRGRDLPPDRVEGTWLLAEVDGEIVGRSSIRFELNDFLRREGGYIGYAVRPAHRRRGHATEILRQSLVIARAGGVDRVLVTCDDDNIGSAAVIEANGGVLEDVIVVDDVPLRRSWID